jgi:hypothetical protein
MTAKANAGYRRPVCVMDACALDSLQVDADRAGPEQASICLHNNVE